MHRHTQTCTCKHAVIYGHTFKHVLTHMQTDQHINSCTHTHTHACMHAYTHVHTCTTLQTRYTSTRHTNTWKCACIHTHSPFSLWNLAVMLFLGANRQLCVILFLETKGIIAHYTDLPLHPGPFCSTSSVHKHSRIPWKSILTFQWHT